MQNQKIMHLIRLMRLNKPIGIFLLMWPMLIALWIAGNGKPEPAIVIIFILGAVIMRSAGCVINDLLDRSFDKFVDRTKSRPLAIDAVSIKEALLLFSILIFVAFILVLQLNILTIHLSFFALLLASVYPLMKRYTHLAQFVLGITFGWAVPMAFSALTNHIPTVAWLLYLATFCWAVVYDTEYAMADRLDDIKLGLRSTAILFGKADKIIIGIFQILMFLILIYCGLYLNFGKIYYLGLFVASFFPIYQQFLIKDRVPANCINAFLNNNYLGAVLFLAVLLDFLTLNFY